MQSARMFGNGIQDGRLQVPLCAVTVPILLFHNTSLLELKSRPLIIVREILKSTCNRSHGPKQHRSWLNPNKEEQGACFLLTVTCRRERNYSTNSLPDSLAWIMYQHFRFYIFYDNWYLTVRKWHLHFHTSRRILRLFDDTHATGRVYMASHYMERW
jgi:hypothetical protein